MHINTESDNIKRSKRAMIRKIKREKTRTEKLEKDKEASQASFFYDPSSIGNFSFEMHASGDFASRGRPPPAPDKHYETNENTLSPDRERQFAARHEKYQERFLKLKSARSLLTENSQQEQPNPLNDVEERERQLQI